MIQALKSYGIATAVGTRAWGCVLGVDLKYELVDGTMAAQPKYAWWFAGVGWTVENHGVDPDAEVTIAPHDWAAGRDPQLDTAVGWRCKRWRGARPPLLPPSDQATIGRYSSWSRRRVREAVSAVLPARSMALSYAARDFWPRLSRRSRSARVAWWA